jgi:hypothetical protein
MVLKIRGSMAPFRTRQALKMRAIRSCELWQDFRPKRLQRAASLATGPQAALCNVVSLVLKRAVHSNQIAINLIAARAHIYWAKPLKHA